MPWSEKDVGVISAELELCDLIRIYLRKIVVEEVQRALAKQQDGHAWWSVEEVAAFLKTTPGAIHSRASRGWLRDDTVKEGKRRFFRREAVLRELEMRNSPDGR